MAYSFDEYLKTKGKEQAAAGEGEESGSRAARFSFDDYLARRGSVEDPSLPSRRSGAAQSLTQYRQEERDLAMRRLLGGNTAGAVRELEAARNATGMGEQKPMAAQMDFFQRSPMAGGQPVRHDGTGNAELDRKVVASAPAVLAAEAGKARQSAIGSDAYQTAYDAYLSSKRASDKVLSAMDDADVYQLAVDGDAAAAQYLISRQDAQDANAKNYYAGGGTFGAAMQRYAASEVGYTEAFQGYASRAAALNDYVDRFIAAVPEGQQREALRAAREKDLASGTKLGDDLVATDYGNFFQAAVSTGWMDEGFAPQELTDFQSAAPGYDEARAKYRSDSAFRDGVLRVELDEAKQDTQWSELSGPASGEPKVSGALADAYKYSRWKETQTAPSYFEDPAFAQQWSEKAGGDLDFGDFTLTPQDVFQLTAEERELFFYFCNKGDAESATQLLRSMKRTLRQRAGQALADVVDVPVIRQMYAFGEGLFSGVENTGRGIASMFTELEPKEVSAGQLAYGELVDRNDGVVGWTLEAAQNVGNMTPAIAMYGVNPAAGTATTFLNARGNAYDEARRSGASHWQAWGYGNLVGASEAALERALGAMGGAASGMLSKKLMRVFSAEGASAARKVLTKFGADLVGEVVEENLQNYLEPAFAMAVGMADEYDAPGFEEFIDTTIVTVMSTFLMSGARMPSEVERTKYDDQVGEYARSLMLFDEGSPEYEAGKALSDALGGLDSGEHISPAFVSGVIQDLEARFSDGEQIGEASGNGAPVHMIDIRDDSQFTMLPYEDTASQEQVTRDVHSRMVDAEQVVEIQSNDDVAAHYPDLRSMKKEDRNSILKRSISELKTKLRSFLSGLRSNRYQFSVNGNVLEAKIYDKGIREVTEKLTQDKANMLYQTDEIFNNAQYLYSTPDYENNSSIYRWDYFYAPVRIGGNEVGVRIAVRDVSTADQSQIYHWGIKKAPSLDGGEGRQAVSQTSVSSDGATNSIPQPLQAVNGENGSAAYAGGGPVYETLVELGVHRAAAESLAKGYDPADGLSAEIYAKGAAEAFLYGRSNFSEAEMLSGRGFSSDLTEAQRNAAYRLGQVFRENQTTREEAAIRQKKAAAKQSGSAKKSQKGAVHYDGDRSRLTERQKTSVEALDKLAQALGVHFYLYESERDADGKPIGENGWYDQKTGDIHIDLNAGELGDGTMLFTAAHELTHFLRQWSPSKFKVLSDFLVEQYGKKGQSVSDLIRNQQEKARRNGRSLGWMQAYEEMVADSMETLLADGAVIEKLSELRAKDKSLVQKIRDWFKSFAAKIRSAYEGMEADSAEGRRVAEMTDAVERLQELFAEGLSQAGENYRAAGGQKNSAQEGKRSYSLRTVNDKKVVWVEGADLSAKELRSYSAIAAYIRKHIGEVYTIIESGQKVYLGKELPNEYTQSKYTTYLKNNDQKTLRAKNMAASSFGEMIEIAENRRWEKTKHPNSKDAKYGIYRYDTCFAFPVKNADGTLREIRAYDAELIIRNASDGKKYLYDIVNIRESAANAIGLMNREARHGSFATASQSNASNTNYTQKQGNVNPQNNNSGETHSDRGNLTKRSVLTELDETKAKDDIERKYLRQYKEKSQLQLAEQKKLSEIRREMDAIPEQKRHTQRARFLRDEEAKTKNRIQNYADALIELETGWLSTMIEREVKPFLADALRRYGTMAPGMNAARAAELPRSIDGETKVSRVARSAAEAQMTPEEFVPRIERAVAEGLLSYAPDKNADQMQRARQWVERFGAVDDATDQWIRDISGKRKLKRDDIARGILLYDNLSNAANKAENETERDRLAKRAVGVLCDLQNMATEAGQMVQAMRLMKTQQPEMQYYALQRSVLALSNNLSKQLPDGIKIDQTLAAQWMGALRNGDENAVETAKKALYRDIAAQVPKTFMDRWNAWRYLCMLGNPKTILRNLGGNIGFMPLKAVKDEIGSALEAASVKFGWMKQEDRTKYAGALFATERGRALLKFAKDDFKNVEDVASGSGKYSDGGSVSSELQQAVQEAKRKFSAPFLKQWQQGTDWAMNNALFGDNGFLKHHYAASFAQAAAARGYSVEEIRNGKIALEQLDQMRAYALKQAQKATYRDINAFSTALRKMHFRGNSRGAVAGNVFIDGVLPFRSTPANVLVRAVEYGPVGLLKAISADVVSLKKGDISAAEYIERLSSGLTGSMLFGLGALLRSLGVIVGGGTDEDDDRIGRQGYALEVGGVSFSLDWLAPAAIPFFMGAETQRVFEEESGVSAAAAFFNSFGTALSPMLEMSMLSGLQDMIDTVTYSGEDSTGQIMYAFFMQPFFNYLSQVIPTVSAQLANALETEDEYTYTGDIGDQLGRNFARSLVRIAEKIPGADWRQQPYVDAYGRTQDKGDLLTRLANSFLNPMYISHLQVTEADKEIERLEDATGEEISPTRRGYTVTVDGERIRLDGDQYTAYATEYGQQYAMLVGSFMASDLYAEMTDAERAEAIREVGSVANEYGKAAACVGYNVLKGQYKKLFEEVENGVPMELALDNRRRKNRLSAESGYENVRAVQEWEAIVDNPSLTEAQKASSLQVSMTAKQKTALRVCMSAGITTAQFVQITREKDRFGDGNGVWSQAELREYLDTSSFSRAQKAAIWEAFGSGWKENPYR